MSNNIITVESCGFDSASKLWFFGDCAFTHKGHLILPVSRSESLVEFRHDGKIYQPRFNQLRNINGIPMLTAPGDGTRTDPRTVNALFASLADDLFEVLDGPQAWLAIGIMLSYAAAPELVKGFGGHPGLWIYGSMAGGKTTVAEWLSSIWGLSGDYVSWPTTTAAGLTRVLCAHHNVPLTIDNYVTGATRDESKEALLRLAYERARMRHGGMDAPLVTLGTVPVVVGECSTTDSATRSRYLHIQILKEMRNPAQDGPRFKRLKQDRLYCYEIGLWLMRHRQKFATAVAAGVDKFLAHKQWRKTPFTNERVLYVHAVAWAAFSVAATQLKYRNFNKATLLNCIIRRAH
jgi:hypothetical protein